MYNYSAYTLEEFRSKMLSLRQAFGLAANMPMSHSGVPGFDA